MKTLRHILAFILVTHLALAGEAAPFIRKTSSTNGVVQLETCIRHYRPASGTGPDIYLAGVAHIGATNYYAAIQKHLDAQKLVMFEGVGRAETIEKGSGSTTNRTKLAVGKDEVDITSLQTKLADALGLVFQLDAIEYDRPNFRNNDISLSQIQTKLKGQNADTEKLLRMLDGNGDVLKGFMKFISSDPKSRALVKFIMIEALAKVGNDIEAITGIAPGMDGLMKVILTDRNEVIFHNLQTELAKKDAPASISMFYGAAHMAGISKRLESDLHYRSVDEQWLPALAVNPTAEGVDPQAAGMIRFALQMAKQLKAAQQKP